MSLCKRVTAKSTEELDGVFGFGLMYVLSGQMGMSQKPSGVAGTHRRESDTPTTTAKCMVKAGGGHGSTT